MVYTNRLTVTVADGGRVECNSKCTNFQWEMAENHFILDMRILKLGGGDMVLGVDFMKKFGPVLFDYQQLLIILRARDREIRIQGMKPDSSLSLISAE